MARVHLVGELRRRGGGAKTVEVEAANVRELIEVLKEEYPEMREVGLDAMSVAVDGEVMTNADFVSIGPDTDIHFLSAISGG